MRRHFYLLVGWLSLGLAIIGIFLPLLPTTPFVLLASICFSRGSKRLHRWLRRHRIFGSIIRDWEEKGVIRRKTKIISVGSIVLMLTYPIFFSPLPLWLRAVLLAIALSVSLFILSRPSESSPAGTQTGATND